MTDTADTLRKTPLRDEHVALGAKMVPFAGWEMPVQYKSGILEEHRAVRTAAGLFDVSHMGELDIRGPDALDLVQRVVTNDASKLDVGQAQYAVMCQEDGGAIDDCIVYRFADRYMIVINASNRDKDRDWVVAQAAGRDVEVTDVSDDVALIEAVVMPQAMIEGRTALGLDLRVRFGVNLLAVSRAGRRIHARLNSLRVAAGDVLLLQGDRDRIGETVTALGCAPLAERDLKIRRPARTGFAIAVFGAAIALAALAALKGYHWPGNVRELRNLMERLAVIVPGDTVSHREVMDALHMTAPPAAVDDGVPLPLKQARSRFERQYILERLAANQGNLGNTARELGIERTNLYRKMKQLGIEYHPDWAAKAK